MPQKTDVFDLGRRSRTSIYSGNVDIFAPSAFFQTPEQLDEEVDMSLKEDRTRLYEQNVFNTTYGHFLGNEAHDRNLGVILPDPVADTGELLEIMMGKTRKGKRPDKLKHRK